MIDRLLGPKYTPPDPYPPHLGLFDVQEVNALTPGSWKIVGTQNWAVEWIIVSVTSGVLGVRPGRSQGGNPIWQFRAGLPPVYLPVGFTGDEFALACQALGTDTCQATVTFVARHNRGFDRSR